MPLIQPVFHGRGGAGNRSTAQSGPAAYDTAPLPVRSVQIPTVASTTTRSSVRCSSRDVPSPSYSIGRGGVGNIASQRNTQKPIGYPPAAIFPFDEELALHDRRFANPAPIYRTGRGGAGNVANNNNSNNGYDSDQCYTHNYQHLIYTANGNILQRNVEDDEDGLEECVSLAGSSVSSAASGSDDIASTPPLNIRPSHRHGKPHQPAGGGGGGVPAQPKQRRGGWKAWGL